MKKLVLLITMTFIVTSVSAQIKVWQKDVSDAEVKIKRKKAKGIYAELSLEKKKDTAMTFLEPFTIGAQLAPSIISTGNSILKQSTIRNSQNYSYELTCYEILKIDIKTEKENDLREEMLMDINYYPKGEKSKSILASYSFDISLKDNQKIIFKCDNLEKNGMPIKTKKNYDFIIETFEFTLTGYADAGAKNSYQKIVELGTSKIVRIIPNYRSKKPKAIINTEAIFLIPVEAQNKLEKLSGIDIACKITYLNPYGLTSSALNSFLETNSDTNKALLNYFLTGQTGN